MMAQRDPWVNMLRTTLAAFAAGVGGADTVLVQPFDTAIPGGLPGTAASFARRMARNTQLLLLEESHVGRVLDPAGGSWFVEDLTRRLAEEAWKHFQDIESRGGFVEARDHVVAEIAEVARAAAATTSPTGAPRSPASTSTPTSPRRRCPPANRRLRRGTLRGRRSRRCGTGPTPISRRRARGRGPLLLPVGPLAEHNVRTTFAANLLASGGVETVNPGTVAAAGRRRCRFRGGAPGGGRDLRHRRALRHGGRRRRGSRTRRRGFARLPGRPGEGARRTSPTRRTPDDYLTAKIDAIAALSTLLTRLGA